MKNLEQREGWFNRHIVRLHKEETTIQKIIQDTLGEQIDICMWYPVETTDFYEKAVGGYLGTEIIGSRREHGMGYHAFEYNDWEFVYYQIVV